MKVADKSISVEVTAETSKFKKGMDDVKDAVDDVTDAVEDAGSGTKKSFGRIGKIFAGVSESVSATFGKLSSKLSEKFPKLSERMGKSFSNIFSREDFNKKLEDFGSKHGKIGKAIAKLGAKGGPIGLLIAAISMIGVAFVAATKIMYEAAKKPAKMFDPARMEKTAGKVEKATRRMKTTLGAVLMPVFEAAGTILAHLANVANDVMMFFIKGMSYIQGFVGMLDSMNASLSTSAEDINEMSEAASAGIASFDAVSTLDTGEMGDAEQSEKIKKAMLESAKAGAELRDRIKEALQPMESIGNIAHNLGGAWSNFKVSAQDAFNDIEIWIENAKVRIGEIFVGIGASVSNAIETAKTKIRGFIESAKEKITEVGNKISTSVSGFFESAKTKLGEIWGAIKTKVGGIGETIVTSIGGAVSKVKTKVGEIWTSIRTSFEETVSKIRAKLGWIWASIRASVGSIGQRVIDSLKGAVEWVRTKLTEFPKAAKKTFSDVVEKFKEAFNEATEWLKGAFKKVYDATIGKAIEGIKEAIEKVKDLIGKLDIVGSAKDWLGDVGDSFQQWKNDNGLNWSSNPPHLASGGVFEPNNPTLAVIGDNTREREIAAPESVIEDAVRRVLGDNPNRGSDVIELSINLDGRTIARSTYKYMELERRRQGSFN